MRQRPVSVSELLSYEAMTCPGGIGEASHDRATRVDSLRIRPEVDIRNAKLSGVRIVECHHGPVRRADISVPDELCDVEIISHDCAAGVDGLGFRYLAHRAGRTKYGVNAGGRIAHKTVA